MATGPNFAPPLPLMQPPACRLLDPPNSPPIDPFLADRLRNHRHLAIAPRPYRPSKSNFTSARTLCNALPHYGHDEEIEEISAPAPPASAARRLRNHRDHQPDSQPPAAQRQRAIPVRRRMVQP